MKSSRSHKKEVLKKQSSKSTNCEYTENTHVQYVCAPTNKYQFKEIMVNKVGVTIHICDEERERKHMPVSL